MAWTVVKEMTVYGNKRVSMLKLTADAATQTVETGLKRVDFHVVSDFGSMSTQVGPTIYQNSNASGIQSFGVLGCTGFSSGDDIYVVCFGV